MGEKLADVEADTACADNRHGFADRSFVAQHVDIAENLRMVLAWDLWIARQDTGGDNHLVEAVLLQPIGVNVSFQPDTHLFQLQLAPVVVDQAEELLLSKNVLGHVQLAADFRRPVERGDPVSALSRDQCRRKAGRALRR